MHLLAPDPDIQSIAVGGVSLVAGPGGIFDVPEDKAGELMARGFRSPAEPPAPAPAKDAPAPAPEGAEGSKAPALVPEGIEGQEGAPAREDAPLTLIGTDPGAGDDRSATVEVDAEVEAKVQALVAEGWAEAEARELLASAAPTKAEE